MSDERGMDTKFVTNLIHRFAGSFPLMSSMTLSIRIKSSFF